MTSSVDYSGASDAQCFHYSGALAKNKQTKKIKKNNQKSVDGWKPRTVPLTGNFSCLFLTMNSLLKLYRQKFHKLEEEEPLESEVRSFAFSLPRL